MNRTWMYSALFLIVFSCAKKQESEVSTENAAADSVVSTSQKDTIHVNEVPLIHHRENDQTHSVISMTGDTVFKFEDYHLEPTYVDIDEDGYKDVRVFIEGATPNQCDNYLFDKTTKIFRKIENSSLDIKKLEGTHYYYSYKLTGCADKNWEGALSKIENWKQIDIGVIEIKDCGEQTDGIKAFRITPGNERKLVDTPPVKKFSAAPESKLNFLNDYWTKNYKKFE